VRKHRTFPWLGCPEPALCSRAAPRESGVGIALWKAVRIQRAAGKNWCWTKLTVDRSFICYSVSRAILDRCVGRSCDKLAREAQGVQSWLGVQRERTACWWIREPRSCTLAASLARYSNGVQWCAVTVANHNLFKLRNIYISRKSCLSFWYLSLWRMVCIKVVRCPSLKEAL
jgi:hypothetical protein